MSDSMVERVAGAMEPAGWIVWDDLQRNPPSGDDKADDERLFCGALEAVEKSQSNARAAIAAMREPSESMLAAAATPVFLNSAVVAFSLKGPDVLTIELDAWRAMLDEALK